MEFIAGFPFNEWGERIPDHYDCHFCGEIIDKVKMDKLNKGKLSEPAPVQVCV